MLTFERTTDHELVRSIVTHPRVRAFSQGRIRADWEPEPQYIYVAGSLDGAVVAVAALRFVENCRPSGYGAWELHCAMLPDVWGVKTRDISREFLFWLGQQTTCHNVVAPISPKHRLAMQLARRVGMAPTRVDGQGRLLFEVTL